MKVDYISSANSKLEGNQTVSTREIEGKLIETIQSEIAIFPSGAENRSISGGTRKRKRNTRTMEVIVTGHSLLIDFLYLGQTTCRIEKGE